MTNYNLRSNLTNRLSTTRFSDYNPTTHARSAAAAGKDKAVALVTGVPMHVIETFQTAFSHTFAAMVEYGALIAKSYSSGFGNSMLAYDAYAEAIRAPTYAQTKDALLEGFDHSGSAMLDHTIAGALSVPVRTAFKAGLRLVTSTVSLATVAKLALPTIFIISVGYAALRVKTIAAEKLETMVDDAFDAVNTLTSDDDEDISTEDIVEALDAEGEKVVTVTEDDIDDTEADTVEEALTQAEDDLTTGNGAAVGTDVGAY